MKYSVLVFSIILAMSGSACWSLDKDLKSPAKTQSSPTSKSGKDGKPVSNDADNGKENENGVITDNKSSEIKSGGFDANLPPGFSRPSDPVGIRMLKEYGAMFVARAGAVPPPKVVFDSESDVSAWQSGISASKETIGGASIELQTPAMKALRDAVSEAQSNGLTITPRGGSDAAKRNYGGTVSNWKSRVDPGLTHWVGKGKLPQAEANRIKALAIPDQIREIFKLEAQGMYFSTGRDKSIIYSVAPPGTSQHISMLAFDVSEHDNPSVRRILAGHGWFQTVVSDLPHFTFLGVPESDLPRLGLKKVSDGGRDFWIPA